ncbi:hypothetical protein B0H16DRAFT_1718459 [Mycena metata]|uniref:Uncharacterized protein n=1 Tax=Mycena metata TaxID=1033252 RepID=A0AAD7JGB1_9AGAR|nr:hypothetical protein B0H16DRAFT_1718459 [Mycena metata]
MSTPKDTAAGVARRRLCILIPTFAVHAASISVPKQDGATTFVRRTNVSSHAQPHAPSASLSPHSRSVVAHLQHIRICTGRTHMPHAFPSTPPRAPVTRNKNTTSARRLHATNGRETDEDEDVGRLLSPSPPFFLLLSPQPRSPTLPPPSPKTKTE